MKNFTRGKMNFILLLVTIISIPFFSFRDGGKYTMVNDKVIKRNDGTLYEKGVIHLMFKDQVTSFNNLSFGINRLDNSLGQFEVTNVLQRYPLKTDLDRRVAGDEDLAKIFTVSFTGGIDPFELSERIMEQNRDILLWAEPAFVYEMDFIPNDPLVNTQYHIGRISSYQAWDISQGDTNVTIGIVDSGSDLDHPDLQANIKINWAENPTNSLDDDGNGFIDDWRGWDHVGNGTGPDNDPNVLGANCNHGSHVSGCASQVTNNGVHGSGIGFKVKLLISKHGDDDDFSGAGGNSLVYNSNDGIIYCYQNGAKAINCSFSSGSFSAFQQQIVTNAWNAGAMVVASAGNDGNNIPRYPASCTNAINVAATNSTDNKASFSNYHSTVDISAPGENIISTVWNNSYTAFNGTSMATPITAGTIGLIRSKNPGWTPQQVLDRLLLSADSIYQIPGNVQYIGNLGTGRVNALKALTDLPVLTLQSSVYNDSLYGNNDKVFDINEIIPIAVNLKNNWLGGNNVSVRLITSDPYVEIVRDSVNLGTVPAYGPVSSPLNNTFQVKAKANCPFDRLVTFQVVSSSSAFVDANGSNVVMTFRQGFAVHNINNLKLALTRDGAIGKKTQSYGSGLFINNGVTNNIFEGSLMIGINNTQVSDVARRGPAPANISDTDFVSLSAYTITTPGLSSNQDGNGIFNDNGAGPTKIGVEVRAKSFAYSNAADDDYILLRYNIKNTNGTALNNVYVGLYMFFNPNGSTGSNVTSVDTLNDVGYTFNNGTPDPYLGAALLTGQNLNFKPLPATDVFTGFTPQKKWDALSSGVTTLTPLGPSANGLVISAGPLTLAAGDTTTIGFAIVKGSNLADLIANTILAKAKYGITIGVTPISGVVPTKYELQQNYPNPFNPATKIRFALPKTGFTKITVYDMLGKEAAVLVNEELKAGTYEADFDGSSLASGMYFYRIQTNEFTETRKMMLIK